MVLFRPAWSDHSGYQHRVAPGAATTGNGAILLFSHSPSVTAFSSAKPSQAMRAADREPAGGEIPVELVCRQPFDDFPIAVRGVEDKWNRFPIKIKRRDGPV